MKISKCRKMSEKAIFPTLFNPSFASVTAVKKSHTDISPLRKDPPATVIQEFHVSNTLAAGI